MSFGLLASESLAVVNVPVLIYTAPSDAVVDVILNNPNGLPLVFSLSIGVANPALSKDFIKYNCVLGPNNNPVLSSYKIEKIPLSVNENIMLTSDTLGLVVRISGADGIDLTTAKYSF